MDSKQLTALDVLASVPEGSFVAAPRYYEDGDFLTYFLFDKECIAHRVNSLLTLFVDEATGALIGCKVKGLARVMQDLKALHISISDGNNKLGLLFLAALGAAPEEEKPRLREQLNRFADAPIPNELQKLAA